MSILRTIKLLVTLMLFSFIVFAETPTVSLSDPALGNKQYVPEPAVGSSALGTGYDPKKNTWAVGEPIDVSRMSYSSGYMLGSCALDIDCHVKRIAQILHDQLVELFSWVIEIFLYFAFIAFEASYKFSVGIIEKYNLVANLQAAFSFIPSKYVAVLVYIAIPELFSSCLTALITVFFFKRVFARLA